jgi:hypothetical protein
MQIGLEQVAATAEFMPSAAHKKTASQTLIFIAHYFSWNQ